MDLLARSPRGTYAGIGTAALLVGWGLAALLFGWAVSATGLFNAYSPLSWVLGGFAGAAIAAWVWRLGVVGQHQLVKSRYDSALLARGGPIDPLAKTFESKRIHLNDFALPSKPLIEGKTFIDCEIVGPANVVLIDGNSIAEQRFPFVDALVIADSSEPSNGYAFRNCVFRGCSFVRITVMVTRAEYDMVRNAEWMRWIGIRPDLHAELVLQPGQVAHTLPYANEGEAAAIDWSERRLT